MYKIYTERNEIIFIDTFLMKILKALFISSYAMPDLPLFLSFFFLIQTTNTHHSLSFIAFYRIFFYDYNRQKQILLGIIVNL